MGVRVLVDVRLHAMSRKPGFSKCRFVAALEGAGICYVHDPRAWESERGSGLVSVGRRERGTGGDACAAPKRRQGCLVRVRGLGGGVGVLCVERDSVCCHWQVVLEMACELDPGIETCDLS